MNQCTRTIFLQKTQSIMNTKNTYVKFQLLVIRIILFLFICLMPFEPSIAASQLELTYDNKTIIYSGHQVRVTMNAKMLDMNQTPGIILDDITMASYIDVFQNGLGASCSYNSSTGLIKINQNGISIEMTLGNEIAHINNEKVKMVIAPKIVTFVNQNETKLLVPVKFVTEALGYRYNWETSSSTVEIWGSTIDYTPGSQRDTQVVENEQYFEWISLMDSYDDTAYHNLITNVCVDYKKDRVAITGLSEINVEVTSDEKDQYIYVDIPSAYNGIGENSKAFLNSKCIRNITISSTWEGTRIVIQKTKGSDYYTSKSGTTFSIVLSDDQVDQCSLIIPKPETVKYSTIKNEDQYFDNKFLITVPGNHVDYYKKNSIKRFNPVISKVSVKLNLSGNTVISIKTSKLQGYKLYDRGSYFIVNIGNPGDIYKNIVVLDAGHGGKDPGTKGGGVYEKNINYKILYTLCKKHFNSPESPIKAYWTRTTDRFVDLYDRAAFAKKVNADLFISLHMNSVNSSYPKGIENFYSKANNKLSSSGLTSYKLATLYENKLGAKLGLNRRGVKTANYVVTHKNTVPSILIELGFMSNKSDVTKLKNTAFQEKSAKLIYTTAVDTFAKYPTGR